MKITPIILSAPMVLATLDGRKSMTRQPISWPCEMRDVHSIVPAPYYGHGRAGEFVPLNDLGGMVSEEHSFDCPYERGDLLWVREKWWFHRPDARLWLRVKDRRPERLHDITEQDAIAEGCPDYRTHPETLARFDQTWASLNRCSGGTIPANPAVDWFRKQWNAVNIRRGRPWDSNPWVWVVTYTVASRTGERGLAK